MWCIWWNQSGESIDCPEMATNKIFDPFKRQTVARHGLIREINWWQGLLKALQDGEDNEFVAF